ncbi:YndJ family transporter [Halobacillus litoralis]|uniref:YndJ family transporter n=1 Tax=Halobacillus litoralis TaxID=45668 RepID=UPI001CFD6FF2|nr:YndJ family transporter [Halobacillus litoralis]
MPGRWIAGAGFFLWLLWKIYFPVGWVEFSLGFSLFVLIPLLLEEALKRPLKNQAEEWLWQVFICSLPFSVAGALSLSQPLGWQASIWGFIWMVFTLCLAVGGLWRVYIRSGRYTEEICIDAGFLYLGIGGVCFFFSRLSGLGIGPFSQREMLVLALFFHGAAFLLSLITGFFGRYLLDVNQEGSPRPLKGMYTVFARVVLVGPLIGLFSLWYGVNTFIMTSILYAFLIAWMCLWWFWISVEFKPWVWVSIILTALFGFTIIGGAFFQGWMVESLSSVGLMASIPTYGFLCAFFFSWIVVFAWRGLHANGRSFEEKALRGGGDREL